jgi:CelD/BcsL family acetyltransferase involved in cellulose biosynthesis
MDNPNALTSAVALCDPSPALHGPSCSSIDRIRPADRPRVQRLSSLTQAEQQAEPWRELCDRAGGAIEQFEWVQACLEAGLAPSILAVRLGEQLSALAPLCRTWRRGLPWLEMIGVDAHYEPMNFIALDDDSRRALCRAVARQRLPIRLGRLPSDSSTAQSLTDAFSGRGYVRQQPRAAAPWIALDDSWTSPESHLNSGRRSDLRRARKRAEEAGPVEFQILSPQLNDLPGLLDEAFAVEERSWKGDQKTALTRDADRGAFFRRYAEAACRQGTLRICFLRIGGQAVAMQIAALQSRRLWLLKVGYDASFSRCSPGMLMTRETIAYAASQKLLTYEFLGVCEPWTSVWTDRARECMELTAYPYSLPGIAALGVDAAVAAVSRLQSGVVKGLKLIKSTLSRAVKAVVSRAARRYVAGDTLADALRVREQLDRKGHSTTLGFWDAEGDAPRQVADRYLEALEAMSGAPSHAYLSIKLPALEYSRELLKEVASKAAHIGCRLHFDALTPDSVDRTRAAVETLGTEVPALAIGFTLPGRWRRSVSDADWAIERGLSVRVVKGQFPAQGPDDIDVREGFLEVVKRLAGRARHVDVATHDESLAAEACQLLAAANTPFDRECLFGMPRLGQSGGKARVYLPYGAAYLPYAVSRLRKNPALAGRLLIDWARSLSGL